MKVRRAVLLDAHTFRYDGEELELMNAYDWRARLEAYLLVGPAWIFENDGKALVLFGYYQLAPGVLQVWMLFNSGAKKYAKATVKEFKKIIEGAWGETYHRIQTLIDKSKKNDARYAMLGGFKPEGILEAFGPKGEDVIMFKMIRKKKCS